MTGNFVFPRNAFLGFDHIFDALQDIHVHANDGYPPHNVVRDGDNKYIIEMAVAGLNKKDIEIKAVGIYRSNWCRSNGWNFNCQTRSSFTGREAASYN